MVDSLLYSQLDLFPFVILKSSSRNRIEMAVVCNSADRGNDCVLNRSGGVGTMQRMVLFRAAIM